MSLLNPADDVIGVSDAGSDMKKCVATHMNLLWGWCLSHGMNAAVKAVDDSDAAEEFHELVVRIKETVNAVRSKVGLIRFYRFGRIHFLQGQTR